MSDLKTLKGFVFRKSNPAVIGVKITSGTFNKGDMLYHANKEVDTISQIQIDGKTVDIIEENQEGVISLKNSTIDKNISEDKIYYNISFEKTAMHKKYSDMNDKERKEFLDYLNSDEYTNSLSEDKRTVDQHIKCKVCGEDIQQENQQWCDACLANV